MKSLVNVVAVLYMLTTYSCTTSPVGPNVGGSSEHGNERVAGVIRMRDGSTAAGVNVYLLPDEYNPVADSTRITQRTAFTDSNGYYEFDSLPKNQLYTVRAYNKQRNTATIMRGVASVPPETAVQSDAGIHKAVRRQGYCTPVDTLTLDVSSSIRFETDSIDLPEGIVVYIPGSPYYCVVKEPGIATFFGVPGGRISLKAYNTETQETILLGDDYRCIDIVPGASLLLPSRSPKPYCIKNGEIIDSIWAEAGDTLTFSAVHPSKTLDGNYMYRFWWGGDSISQWETTPLRKWSWNKPGLYSVQTQAMRGGVYLAWSDPVTVEIVDNNYIE